MTKDLMQWRNEPPSWSDEPSADGTGLRLRTAPDTDFWRRTHYGFIRDSGHVRYAVVDGDFSVRVCVRGRYRDQYDQAGLMVRADETTWLKCGIELVDGRQRTSAVVTRDVSDWAVAPLDPAPESIWFEVRRRGLAVEVLYGIDAPTELLRLAPLTERSALEVGMMAASPDGAGFDAAFSGFAVERA
jgi:regulation of enolase protein 1 (concanavalin A-like superfamily)